MRHQKTSAAALAVLVSGTALAAAGSAQAATPEATPKPRPAATAPVGDLLGGLPLLGDLTKGAAPAKSAGAPGGLLGGLPLGG
jgi:hypothetical protein